MSTRMSDLRAQTERTTFNSRKNSRSDNVDSSELVTAATISFVNSTSSIDDSGNGLAGFVVGTIVEVKGSMINDGKYVIDTVAAGSIGVTPAPVDEVDGETVQLRVVDDMD